HECIFSADEFKKNTQVRTLDIAKRLLDYEIHPPTVYFPLIVSEAIMIEPTETENKETIDKFIEVMKSIATEAQEEPWKVQEAPYMTPVTRLDEVKAAREPILKYTPNSKK
ncbi:MAG TPA: aminomethyl-transferring glycine dehydrogenase subunit GcvPB, partial [Planctomycetota bacterium]|nr:aminomethyl-transferring glycine dehydrogenase subunit GcvPB [Planctomycetota bacterium]